MCGKQKARNRVNYPGNIGKIQNGGKNSKNISEATGNETATPPKNVREKKRKKENSEGNEFPPVSLLPPARVLSRRHPARCLALLPPTCGPGKGQRVRSWG